MVEIGATYVESHERMESRLTGCPSIKSPAEVQELRLGLAWRRFAGMPPRALAS
jgi:hypothetical protein